MSIDRRPVFRPYRPPTEQQRAKILASLGELTEEEKEVADNPMLIALRRFSRDVDVGERPPFRKIMEIIASK